MLDIQQLSVAYGGGGPALEDFSLHMKTGEIVALGGESGSGKATAIRTVMGLLPPGGHITSGTIRFAGQELTRLPERQWQALRGHEIAMIFQDSGAMLNPIRTIGGQFMEYIRAHERGVSRREARRRGGEMLERMGLPNVDSILSSYPFQLSGGQRQRVGIAMAMTFRPRLLLADEPTSALDVTTQAQIVAQMMELRRDYGTAILLVTHNLGVAAYMADQLLVMRGGHIVDRGGRGAILGPHGASYTQELLGAVPDLRRERYV